MRGWFDEPAEGIVHARCGLQIDGPREAHSVEDAWALLPIEGEGWVALTDRVKRFQPGQRAGLLVHAEVAAGKATVILRHEDGVWRAWTWHEREGDDHRVVRRRYCSSAPRLESRNPEMEYATYWTKQDDDGVAVWSPVGSRFCGWRE
jgi:hypothetical protein